MEFEIFKQKCIDIFDKNAKSGRNLELPTLDDTLVEKLFALTERMLEVNLSMNLTAITDVDAVILRHYVDSLTVSKYIPQGASVIDVGCGAGFPSLPLAIFRPDLAITSLDGTAKRIEYVRSTANLLGLDNINAIAGRAEEYAKMADFREKFDIATARAVANLPVLTELCLPFVKIGGSFVAMKAQQASQELALSESAIKLCGGSSAASANISLTSDGVVFEDRVIISVKKSLATPSKYPRHYSQISKKPL